jgi:hypothetical protein
MTRRVKNLEKFTVAYLSLLFLLTSTLSYGPLKALTRLNFAQTLIMMSIPSLILTLLLKKEVYKRPTSSSTSNSNLLFDVLIAILLFFSTLAVLILKVRQGWIPATYDELFHLSYTNMIYRALGSGDYKYLAWLAQNNVNPMLPYLLTVTLVPYSDFSLNSARMLASVISSFVPVAVYLLVKEYDVSRKISALTAFALTFSSLFQSQGYLYIFDGLSTLLFTVAFYFLVKVIRNGKRIFLVLSSLLFYLLLVTKYPAAFLFLIIYIITFFLLMVRKHWSVKECVPLIVVILSFFLFDLFIMVFMPKVFSSLMWAVFLAWGIGAVVYSKTVIWDLILGFGFSPYVVLAVIAYRLLRSKERSGVTFISVLTIALAFLTLVPSPVTRRVIQVLPVFFATIISYSHKQYSNTLLSLVVLNLSWWGILSLVSIL